MNSNELVDLGPTRWAEQQIENALVFLPPELRLCASGLEGAEFSQQVQWKDNPMLDTSKVTSRLRACRHVTKELDVFNMGHSELPFVSILNRVLVRNVGSISVSGQLRTYPSPNPTVTLTY